MACRQVTAIANRYPPTTCGNCGRRFTNDDRVRVGGNGQWRNGKLLNIEVNYAHFGSCRADAAARRE